MPVASSFPRIMAQHLPTDLALSPSNDLTLEKGDIAHSPSGRHRTEHQRAKRIPYLAGLSSF